MKLRFPARPREDPLVPGAVKPKAPIDPNERWRDMPAHDAKRKPCSHCGDMTLRGCKDHEYKGCLNFHTAERRKQKEAK